MHKLIVDSAHNIVKAQLAGLLTPEDVCRYGGDLGSHFKTGKLRPGYRMLLDVSECSIQPRETIEAFQRHVAEAPKSSLIAIVTGRSIIRMQVRRVMKQPYAKLFDDRAEALTWLVRTGDTSAA